MPENSLRELDLKALTADHQYLRLPGIDEVIFFLMLDRFSVGKENRYRDNLGNVVTSGATPPFAPADCGIAVRTEADAARWREAGTQLRGSEGATSLQGSSGDKILFSL